MMVEVRVLGQSDFSRTLVRLRRVAWQRMGAKIPESRFQFNKRRQLFIRVHNETLSVVAVRMCNPDRSPVGIDR